MNKRLIIIGAGGHGNVAADIARLMDYDSVLFLDDAKDLGGDIVGKTADYHNFAHNSSFFVAVGNNKVRKSISERIMSDGYKLATLVHPNATVSNSVEIGYGVIIMAGAVVNCHSYIGNGAIINTCSSVDHDCNIGAYSHVSVGAHIAGNVRVGETSFICAGATVINNIDICDNAVIGAGAVVVKNIEEPGTYVGVPANKTKK